MRYTSPGRHRTVEAFREHLRHVAPALDCDVDLQGAEGPLGRAFTLGERTLGNRFAVHPMEGWDGTGDGLPSEHTRRRWRGFGRSGAKLLWGGEAFAVQRDGRANPRQLFLNPDADVARGLRELLEEVHDGHREAGYDIDDLYCGLQLTHSGRFARPDEGGAAPRATYRHPVLDERFGVRTDDDVLTDAELEGIAQNYVRAARLAQDVGFEFVDVKCCHGYLLHELLGAKARSGSYGGSFENRTRLFRGIVDEIRRDCPGLDLGVRLSLCDVFPHSRGHDGVGAPEGWDSERPFEHGFGLRSDDPRRFDFEEPFRFLALLEELGITLVSITLASPYYAPHLQRPAAYPPSDGYAPPRDPLLEVAEHLLAVRACREAFPGLTLVGAGYSYLQQYLPHVAQYEVGRGHVDFVGLGRMVLVYPELAGDALRGRALRRERICRTFSDCTTAPRNGLISGCYPLDPYYKALPEAGALQEIKRELKQRFEPEPER